VGANVKDFSGHFQKCLTWVILSLFSLFVTISQPLPLTCAKASSKLSGAVKDTAHLFAYVGEVTDSQST
ncbi:MAG: hypothetical protein LUC90_03790, partial [Lachnospiraceae bacterium]|nr:hypothetical protein [Lachnospiraceae bacterium]